MTLILLGIVLLQLAIILIICLASSKRKDTQKQKQYTDGHRQSNEDTQCPRRRTSQPQHQGDLGGTGAGTAAPPEAAKNEVRATQSSTMPKSFANSTSRARLSLQRRFSFGGTQSGTFIAEPPKPPIKRARSSAGDARIAGGHAQNKALKLCSREGTGAPDFKKKNSSFVYGETEGEEEDEEEYLEMEVLQDENDGYKNVGWRSTTSLPRHAENPERFVVRRLSTEGDEIVYENPHSDAGPRYEWPEAAALPHRKGSMTLTRAQWRDMRLGHHQ